MIVSKRCQPSTRIYIASCYVVSMTVTVTTELSALFWAKVSNVDGQGCWEWQGAKSTSMGYGCMSIGGCHAQQYAHRLSWQIANGPIPKGMWVLHRCDNPPCVRPDHLFLGTCRDNNADKVAKGRQHHGEQTGNAVLTDEKVRHILSEYATGEIPVFTISTIYNISEATVRAIVNGVTWTHVAGPRLTRAEIVALGKKHRAVARIKAKRAAGWPSGACSVCGERGHYKPRCPRRAAA